jgi:hypothetical protein
MRRVTVAGVFVAGWGMCAAGWAQAPPAAPAETPAASTPKPAPEAPTMLALPDENPYACKADWEPNVVTHDFPSGVESTLNEIVSVRLDGAGKIQEIEFAHDPIPSLEARQRESFAKWDFGAPMKGGAASPGWATLSLDLDIEYSRPQVASLKFTKISAGDPLPTPLPSNWSSSWLATAPPRKDLEGALPPEELDAPVLARKTKWYADRYKGPFPVKLWLRVAPQGRVDRVVPVALADPAVLPYLLRAVGKWTITPAHNGPDAVTCWGLLEIEGTISYDISLKGAASVQKSVGPPPSKP